MRIRVTNWGRNNDFYAVYVKVDAGEVSEDWMSQAEVDELAVRFLDDTLLNGCRRDEVVAKLIESDVIDREMIVEYLEEDVAT